MDASWRTSVPVLYPRLAAAEHPMHHLPRNTNQCLLELPEQHAWSRRSRALSLPSPRRTLLVAVVDRGGSPIALSDFLCDASNPSGVVDIVRVSRDVGLGVYCLHQRDVKVVSECVGVAAVDYPMPVVPLHHHFPAVGQS